MTPGAAAADGLAPDRAGGLTRLDAGALLRRAASGEGERAGPHLVIREPRAGERVVALTAGCTVGRGRLAALRLADPSASRLHLRLRLDAAGATAQDLGSRNGLRVNGGRARGRHRLRSGDELVVGETRLRYVDPLESSGQAAGHPAPARPRPGPTALLVGAAGLLLVAALALALG